MAQYGPPWDFSALDRVLDRIMSTPKYEVLAGYPAESGQHEGSTITNPTLAAIHDLGAPGAGIPERRFLRQSVENRRTQYTKQLAADLRLAYAGQMTIEEAYERLALAAEAGVKMEITHPSPSFVPLKPATVARRIKHTTTPLLDEGHLRNSALGIVRKAGQTK